MVFLLYSVRSFHYRAMNHHGSFREYSRGGRRRGQLRIFDVIPYTYFGAVYILFFYLLRRGNTSQGRGLLFPPLFGGGGVFSFLTSSAAAARMDVASWSI